MRTLFDGVVPIDYSQMYVTSDELPDMTQSFAGQVNGLCGAGVPGALMLMTGTPRGRVRLTIELHEQEPPAAPAEWEEVVEVSFPRPGRYLLCFWPEGAGSGPAGDAVVRQTSDSAGLRHRWAAALPVPGEGLRRVADQ